jgi:hypothetical protein
MDNIRKLLREHPLLTIVASNVRDGESLALHPEGFVKRISDAVRSGIHKRFPHGGASHEDLIVELEAICLGELPDRKGSDFLLGAESVGFDSGDEWYTTVTKVEHWLRIVDSSTLNALSRQANVAMPFKPMSGSLDPSLIKILSTVKKGEFTPSINFKIGHPLVWITPRMRLEERIATSDRPAERARDHLGLVHHSAGTHLMALHLPASTIELVKSNRPTFADAGQHRRFMVLPPEVPAPFPQSWGQTLDLAEFEDSSRLASGGAERVCARIGADQLNGQKIGFEYLGSIRLARGQGSEADDIFASEMVARNPIGFSTAVNMF